MTNVTELVGRVRFIKVNQEKVPGFDPGAVIVTYQPDPPHGWVIANSWHQANGDVCVVLQREEQP